MIAPGSAPVHTQQSSPGTAPAVDLPRCRLAATSQTASRLRGGRTLRSAESGTRTSGSSGPAHRRAQPGSVLQRRDRARAPSPVSPRSLRCSLHLRRPTLRVLLDRGCWRTRSAMPCGWQSYSPRAAARTRPVRKSPPSSSSNSFTRTPTGRSRQGTRIS